MNEELLTVPEVLAELRVPRSTWFYWRQTGKGPRVIKLPNGRCGSAGRRSVGGSVTWSRTPREELGGPDLGDRQAR
ncbi:helix-turn-helix transcriptional regulator [Micromonospora peucetia]|uniref:helix-turn-helix transcriptional regulator n=1 Tax=Micromonospora peucetia TaxID=47871 RepID=UPI003EBF5ACC